MSKLTVTFLATTLIAAFATFAQTPPPISTDGTDPKSWHPKLDAVIAGVKNHRIIYEYKEIRVLSVTVAPGEVEVAHHHQWPSVIVLDWPTKPENRDSKGNLLVRKGNPDSKQESPMVI